MNERLGYRPELEGLRGIAILLVVSAHVLIPAAGAFNSGTFGVDLFFVLSGFLITTLLLEEWQRDLAISLHGFYRRRARRLLPALFTAIGIVAILALLRHPDDAGTIAVAFVARASYIANFLVAFTRFGVGGDTFTHLWSLAQEEQFYLLWPPLLIMLLRRRVRPVPMLCLLGAVIVAVNADRWAALIVDPGRVWVSPDTHADPILFGCAAAIVRFHRLVRIPRVTALVAAVLCIAALYWYENVTGRASYGIALPVFAFACATLILALSDAPGSPMARGVAVAPLRLCGRISYSWYLWNSPIIGLYGHGGAAVVGGLASFCVAAISYRAVEQPFLAQRGARDVAHMPVIAAHRQIS